MSFSTRHLKVSPVTVATSKLQTLGVSRASSFVHSQIAVPEFSESGIVWRNYSQLLRQYNFTVEKPFTIRGSLPLLATDFLACIRFRVGNKITRYKLWTGVGEVLPSAFLYVNQTIQPNFSIEIWSVTDETTPDSDGFSIILGIRHDPIDCNDVSDVQEDAPIFCPVDGAVITDLGTSVKGQWDFAVCEQHLDNA